MTEDLQLKAAWKFHTKNHPKNWTALNRIASCLGICRRNLIYKLIVPFLIDVLSISLDVFFRGTNTVFKVGIKKHWSISYLSKCRIFPIHCTFPIRHFPYEAVLVVAKYFLYIRHDQMLDTKNIKQHMASHHLPKWTLFIFYEKNYKLWKISVIRHTAQKTVSCSHWSQPVRNQKVLSTYTEGIIY